MSNDGLLERLGGQEGIGQLVQDMYQRVFDDPELAPFFENVDAQRLKRMQTEFITSALGGPINYSGAELQAIHAGRGITEKHFARFVGHLADAMEARQIDQHDLDSVLGQLALYQNQIVGKANVDG